MAGGRRQAPSSSLSGPSQDPTVDSQSSLRTKHGYRTRYNTRLSQEPYTPPERASSVISRTRSPAIGRREQDYILASRNDEEMTRKTVAIPVSNAVFDRARLEVVDQKHNFADLLQQYGYTAIIDAAYHQSRSAKHPFLSPDSNTSYPNVLDWRNHGVQVLSDTPLVMLQALLDDSLTEKVMSGIPEHARLADYFDQSNYERFITRRTDARAPHVNRWVLRHKSQFAPAFYVRILADAQGESPTPLQLRKVVFRMRQYISGDDSYVDTCVAIDNASRGTRSDRTSISERQHYFLDGSTQRVQTILTFCEALELLLQTHAPPRSPQETLPFRYKFKYFGFTVNDTDRSKKHEAGNTNWLKSFFHSICRVEFQDDEGQPDFDWHHHVVGFATSIEECQIGEELFCQIGSGYYQTGLGFNIQPAGLSVTSAHLDGFTHKEATQKWKDVLRWRDEGPDFGDQLHHEITICLPAYRQVGMEKQETRKRAKQSKDDTRKEEKRRAQESKKQAKQRRLDRLETKRRLSLELDNVRNNMPTRADVEDEIRKVEDTHRDIEQQCAQQLPDFQHLIQRSHAHTIADLEDRAWRLFADQ